MDLSPELGSTEPVSPLRSPPLAPSSDHGELKKISRDLRFWGKNREKTSEAGAALDTQRGHGHARGARGGCEGEGSLLRPLFSSPGNKSEAIKIKESQCKFY